ncbi:EAL domain-containing protein [Erythrobacter sp. LQ02-29]|uniref:EAL domain-containing protein n=1 Tax=Erythrobacter sp. LQ02-29 TaxID=2920384 RepID=UPI001F4ED262|nr:EAL domain-containing protein [Erythrobacter sp. LQ02-29]MCP9221153.1 EAL domain-containing protein [Erythrobacter sp. LQ02-29]
MTRKNKPALTPGKTALRLLIAAAIVAALSALSLFKPVDNFLYAVQYLHAPRDASGKIVFVGLSENPMEPKNEAARREVVNTLRTLDAAGPSAIFVDVPVPASPFRGLDKELSEVVRQNASRVFFIDRRYDDFEGRARQRVTDRAIRGPARAVLNERYHDFMGYSWEAPRSLSIDGKPEWAAAPSIAGVKPRSTGSFIIDYRYRLPSIEALDPSQLSDLSQSALSARVRGKVVVLGAMGETESTPGHLDIPASFITILAAETLLAGPPVFVTAWYLVLLLGVVIAFAVSRGQPRLTRWVFLGCVLATIVLPLLGPQVGLLIRMGGPLMYLLVAGGMILLNAQRQSARKFDPRFNLPTFEALEDELADAPLDSALVVAKVQNFDTVLAAVGSKEQAEYAKRLADRFRVIDPRMPVYVSGSHFAWISPAMLREDLESHLLGLRALFSEPIKVENVPIDIGVTFGIDATSEANPSAKIAQARSAVNATNQADLPVVFAEANTSPNRIWSLSLQHKVDKALAEGRIFPVYQPQFAGSDHRLHGVEALVRWIDEERGVISPGEFIGQCEKAGRMEAITQTVLRQSMREMCEANVDGLQLSVNVSATLLHDHRLVRIVRDTLDESGFPPSLLVLEVTESWRIIDERVALSVMNEIASLGVRWSIDDFGVQSATMETLLKYPFSEVKIDRVFTQAICTSKKALAMVRMICAFGKELNIDVVAEGAEDQATLRMLEKAGSPRVQGFVLARPMGMDEVAQRCVVAKPSVLGAQQIAG